MLESASPCEGWEGETGARCARASPGLCRLISKIVLKTQRNFQCLRFRAQVRCAEGTNAARRVWRPTRKTDQQVCFGGAAQQRELPRQLGRWHFIRLLAFLCKSIAMPKSLMIPHFSTLSQCFQHSAFIGLA